MPGEFFEDRELEREVLDGFPTPLADVFDDLTYERDPRGRLAKLLDLFRVTTRLLALYALAATLGDRGDAANGRAGDGASSDAGTPRRPAAPAPPPPQALNRLRKLLRQGLSEGDWIGLARESVRPFARTPAPFPLDRIAALFFRPGTEQAAPSAAALERLLKTRNEWAHGVSGTEAEVEALVAACRSELETVLGQLRWLGEAPWFVPEDSVVGTASDAPRPAPSACEGRRLMGTTPRRGFRVVTEAVAGPVEAGVVYALGPEAPVRLGPLVQWREAKDETGRAGDGTTEQEGVSVSPSPARPVAPSFELFLLEAGGRKEAKLHAFPSGREAASAAALKWLEQRVAPEASERQGPIFDPPMIDRRSECEEFRRLLRRVLEERHGQVLVIEGEAGIGKTKFLRFCRGVVAPMAVKVMHGAYRDHHAGGAYSGVREALEELFGVEMLERDAAGARIAERLPELGYGDSGDEAADLAAFLTQFLRPLPGAGGAAGGHAVLDYVIGRIQRFLWRASLHVPLLLLLEDLHWADAESLAFFQHMASVLVTDPTRLLIIATTRAGDRNPNPAMDAALQRMARFEGTFTQWRFPRLGEDDTAKLIEESLQADLEDKAAVYQLAEGNPLHVLSILRHLHSEALLEATASGWRVKRGVQLVEILPSTVREVIGLRVQRLVLGEADGEARRETLIWAAVAGWRFDAEVLAEAVGEGAPHLSPRLDAHLDALNNNGILRECDGVPGDVLEFDHQLLREVVLAEAEQEGPRAMRARHRCLAAAKRRRVERGDRGLLPEVAHHYLEAREWAEAVRYHQAAGAAARDSLAFRDAAGFYETAVRLLAEHPDLPLPAEEQADLYYAQAEVLETLGRMEEALSAYRATQARARDNPILWARSERSIAFLLCLQGQLEDAAAACERARETLEGIGAEIDKGDALRTLGVIEIYRGQYEAAMEHLQRALAIYEREDHREGLARCYGTLAHLYHGRGDVQAMLEAAQQARAIWQDLGLPVSLGRALNNVACALIRLGQDCEAVPLLARAAEILERHHVEKDLPNVYHSLAEALLRCNNGEEARPYLERGLDSARRVGEVRTVADFHRLLAQQAAADRPEEARQHFEEALRICGETDLEPQKAQILMEFGDFLHHTGASEEALRHCEAALEIHRRLGTDHVEEAEAAVARIRETSARRHVRC